MIKVITVSLFILAFAGCSADNVNDTAAREPVASFRVESEQPDPVAGAITVNIQFLGPTTQSQVKSAAEFVIADRKDRYRSITVNSFISGVTLNDKPFGVSRLEKDEITHHFNQQSGSVRIPTH